jgi:hypothetical protein
MKYLILLVTMFIFGYANAQSSSSFDGVWVGQGYQIDNNETWSIKLIILGDDITIEYPSLGCAGRLKKSKTDQNKLYLQEKILEGDFCIDNGKIELERLTTNELRFKWSFSDGTPGSFATLIKF